MPDKPNGLYLYCDTVQSHGPRFIPSPGPFAESADHVVVCGPTPPPRGLTALSGFASRSYTDDDDTILSFYVECAPPLSLPTDSNSYYPRTVIPTALGRHWKHCNRIFRKCPRTITAAAYCTDYTLTYFVWRAIPASVQFIVCIFASFPYDSAPVVCKPSASRITHLDSQFISARGTAASPSLRAKVRSAHTHYFRCQSSVTLIFYIIKHYFIYRKRTFWWYTFINTWVTERP